MVKVLIKVFILLFLNFLISRLWNLLVIFFCIVFSWIMCRISIGWLLVIMLRCNLNGCFFRFLNGMYLNLNVIGIMFLVFVLIDFIRECLLLKLLFLKLVVWFVLIVILWIVVVVFVVWMVLLLVLKFIR